VSFFFKKKAGGGNFCLLIHILVVKINQESKDYVALLPNYKSVNGLLTNIYIKSNALIIGFKTFYK
jgi:hypothetical protein